MSGRLAKTLRAAAATAAKVAGITAGQLPAIGDPFRRELVVDMFAGGGGASTGLEAALGRPVSIAINHDAIALAAHKRNHPETLHLVQNVWDVDPAAATGGKPVCVLWASPDCTHHSNAKGDKPRDQGIRALADVVIKWARALMPRVIFLENVAEFRDWGALHPDGHPLERKPDPAHKGEEFSRWVGELRALGYVVEWRMLDASHFGAPTKRKRLFLIARRDGLPIQWPAPTHGGLGLPAPLSAASCIDWDLPCPSIFDRKKPLALKTQWRIAQGLKRYVLEADRPFIVPTSREDESLEASVLLQSGYGERKGQRARVLDIQQPLTTVVAMNVKHALVSTWLVKHYGGVVGLPMTAPFPALTAGGTHVAQVQAFLTAFYGEDGTGGQSLFDPARTITAKARLGLVTVAGVNYRIADIGLRMLEPKELLRAQFGPFAEGYDLSAASSKAGKVRLIGNSVCPQVAEAIARANIPRVAA